VLEVYEGISGPELLLHLLPRHHFARTLDKRGQNLEGFFLQFYPVTVAPQFTAPKVNFEVSDREAR
jgi:hypothetical protein